MATSRLDTDGDWTFGQGLANYARGSEEIAQNLKTRIKMFLNDWFLDVGVGIDWFTILGNKSNEQTIISEINRVTQETDGVRIINSIELTQKRESREADISIKYVDIFNETFEIEIGITNGV